MPMSEAFAEFEPEPFGRASIAVVHRATLHDGRRVAVKIIRPGIEHQVATDLDLMQPLFEVLARQTGDQMAGSVLQLVDSFRIQVGEEMDLRNEARTMAHFRRLLTEVDLPQIVVPEPYPELSGPNVLTMELLDGVPIDDLAQVAALGVDPAPDRRGGGPLLLPARGARGYLPRRRPRRQHAPVPRRPDRDRRLGDRRAPRPRHPPLRPPDAGGRAGRGGTPGPR